MSSRVEVVLAADVAAFKAGLEEAKGAMQELGGEIGPLGSVLQELGPAGLIAAAGIGAMVLAATEAGEAIVEVVDHWAEAAHQLEILSAQTGISVESLQEMKFAAAESGTTIEAMSGLFTKLDAAIEKGSPGLQKLGLDLSQLKNESPQQAFEQVAEAISGVSSEVEKIGLAREVFGKAGAAALPFIENMNDARQVAQEMGLVLSEQDVKAAASLGAAGKELDSIWDGLKDQFAAGVTGGGNFKGMVESLAPAVHVFGEVLRASGEEVHNWLSFFDNMTGFSEFVELMDKFRSGPMPSVKGGSAYDRFMGSGASNEDQLAGNLPGMKGADAAKEMDEADKARAKAAKKAAAEAAAEATREATEREKEYSAVQKLATAISKDYSAAETKLGDVYAANVSPLQAEIQKTKDARDVAVSKAQADFTAYQNAASKVEVSAEVVDAMQAETNVAIKAANDQQRIDEGKLVMADRIKREKVEYSDLVKQSIADGKAQDAVDKQEIENMHAMGDAISVLSQDLGAAVGMLEAFGMSATSTFAVVASSAEQGMDIVSRSLKSGELSFADMAKAAGSIFSTGKSQGAGKGALSGGIEGAEIGSLFGPEGAAIGAGAGALLGALGGLFGGKSDQQKEADIIGRDFGVKVSDSLAKAISDQSKSEGISKEMAELLNIDKILQESGADPGSVSNKIGDLMNAVKLGAVNAGEGIKELGKDFLDLQKAADGGSVSSEAAMIKMIQRAHELGESIPEVDAALADMSKKAEAGLEAYLEGLSGKDTSSGLAAANQQLFGAVSSGATAGMGALQADQMMGKAFDDLVAKLPKGTALTGDTAEFAHMHELLKDKGFAGAASGAQGLADVTKNLLDSGNLGQATVGSLGTATTALYGQALATKGATALDAEKAILPELTALQHAQELGAKLDPQSAALLTKAQNDGLLPMKTLAEQSLEVQKQIATNTGKSYTGDAGSVGVPTHKGPAGAGGTGAPVIGATLNTGGVVFNGIVNAESMASTFLDAMHRDVGGLGTTLATMMRNAQTATP